MSLHLDRIGIDRGRFPDPGAYPFSLPVLRETPALELRSPVTCFVGENGSGKSTLLEAIARQCGIAIWENVEGLRATRNRFEKVLHQFISIHWTHERVPGSFFSSRIFQTFAEGLDEWASVDPALLARFGGQSLMTQSHGQSLMAFFASRYRLRGLHLLDEPETALSPRSQIALTCLLRDMAAEGHAQFIVATHSPILLACPNADILSFDYAPVTRVSYEETDHYQVYSAFMKDPAGFTAGTTASA